MADFQFSSLPLHLPVDMYCEEELSLPPIYVFVRVFISIWTRGLLLYSMDFNLLLSVFFFFDVQIVPDVASGSLFEVILMSF